MTPRTVVAVSLLVASMAAACTPGTEPEPAPPEPTSAPITEQPSSEPELHVMLMWHQHQPFYPKNADGLYTRPWVRLHATKDYVDMAELVEQYPGLRVTFNLTPVLLLQLEDLAGGARDVYWAATEVPTDELSPEERRFIAERFFDTNPGVVARFPRYQELADERTDLGVRGVAEAWTDGDFRDLQTLFNLAWTDPDFLAMEPLATLVAKASGFSEADKRVVLEEHARILAAAIPIHRRLWEEDRIEITTTPLAHPILPLLADTSLAAVGDPAAVLPGRRFRQTHDADEQVIRGLDVAERLLGARPTGMWPGEGSVADGVMWLFSKNGVNWVATGEDVLSQSLGIGSFERDGDDTVLAGDLLYRPWQAEHSRYDPVAMFFRDNRISDQIGFEYSGMDAVAAVDDLMSRLGRVRDTVDGRALPPGTPPVVSIVLDGENAWDHYPNDGKHFLEELYSRLSTTDWVSTITPSEYLARYGEPEALDEVFPASWFQPNFATWIGEREEATAWDYLDRVREDLRLAERSVPSDAYAAAFEAMLFAEGSDWFWWYGADQDSGNDAYFDSAFRELLGQVYDRLGRERPAFVNVPIIPATPVAADAVPAGLFTIDIDGDLADWEGAGTYSGAGVGWVFDAEMLYLRIDSPVPGEHLYLGAPDGPARATDRDGRTLGFGATHWWRSGKEAPVSLRRRETDSGSA